ncbi:MAG: colanic acid biosynthesis glycosyltransferase WcaL [Moorea sp. SIOASIH]|uniref:glycosyltransferase n=1 Tax=Moorena sp. SIOASIH TaxID=2607817 RepID=UPI0013BA6A2D|nr:glycosyltransferase [Moorena sp. SIOASIH]NEO41397.1 colanic acid biosynthesis glycosyltransferase WcaL [Moorena sp. SIOASIH]
MKNKQLVKTRVKVIHSHPTWLTQTQTWMYNQVYYLPDEIENHIVCGRQENLDQFWLPNIHALSDKSKWPYFWDEVLFLDKVLRERQFRRHQGLLVDVAKRENVSILHSHFGHIGWVDLDAAKKAGLKQVVTFYGRDVNYLPKKKPRWLRRYQELFAKVDRILCEGPHMAQCIVNLGCPADKVKVQHLGISIEEIAFKPRVWNTGEPLRVLIASSFREKKGIPYALEALGQLQHQVSLEVTIIGDANREKSSQDEKKKILATIEKHNLHSKVNLLGYQPYKVLFEEAYKHHIFLSPSVTASDGDTEGGAPVSLIEMAATGMPIISTKHCDIPEVIIDGVTGLLAEERDVEGLVSHLQQLVAHPEQWYDLVQAGRKHIEAEYDAQIQGSRLAAIYIGLNAMG